MDQPTVAPQRLEPQPLPESISSIQPGGGTVMKLELWWGRLRRAWLRRFRRGYVQAMRQRRKGHCESCPHDIIDPRDLKFYRNVCGFSFAAQDDRFRWRDRLPVARDALAEVVVLGGPPAVAALVSAWFGWWLIAVVLATMASAAVAFFRDPRRTIPTEPGVVVAPADGTVMDIEDVPQQGATEGPAVRIGIFLSLLNVHVNRAPLAGRVIALDYRPGKFLAAMRERASEENERMEIVLEEEQEPHRTVVVRQIAGAVARRIVCTLRPGQTVQRGEKIGLIKLGSRTEVVLPKEEGLELFVQRGNRVRAGVSRLARYRAEGTTQ